MKPPKISLIFWLREVFYNGGLHSDLHPAIIWALKI
jgi:hypothetical protein